MDFKKIFIPGVKPTSIGGQAVMDGVMMRGPDRMALAMRLPGGDVYLRTEKQKPPGRWRKIPLVRGVVSFVQSLATGMGTLMDSADILERYLPEEEAEEPTRFENWLNDRFGPRAAWNVMLTISVILAIAITVLGFVIFPTWAVNWLGAFIHSDIALNLIEGIFRILLFLLYIVAIRKMDDVDTMFRYHGAEHKSIHTFESGLELIPENARQFPTLHPRCGTSFLMFVMIVSLLLFSFLGWPSLGMRIASRILLIPVIAGISYELLRWAGRSDNVIVRWLSVPGLLFQKITTAEPDDSQVEIAMTALNAVLVDPDAPDVDGVVGEEDEEDEKEKDEPQEGSEEDPEVDGVPPEYEEGQDE